MSPLARFSALLDAERQAALAADVGALAALQGDKESVLAELAAAPPSAEAQAEIVRKARTNVGLLRQLADLHRALLVDDGGAGMTYGPHGATRLEPVLALRRI